MAKSKALFVCTHEPPPKDARMLKKAYTEICISCSQSVMLTKKKK